MTHALVIGGTGMLKDVTLHLLKEFDKVSVIARNESGFGNLKKEAREYSLRLKPLQVDYTDYEILKSLLIKSIKEFGEISLVVSWIHSTAPKALYIIADLMNQTSSKCELYEVLGSSYANPQYHSNNRNKDFEKFENINYHKIILGFVLEGGKSRWLTNSEISGGIIKVIEKTSASSIIGVVEPWSSRP